MLRNTRKTISRQLKERSWIFILLFVFFASGVAAGCNNFQLTEENSTSIIAYFSGESDFRQVVYDSFVKNFKLVLLIFAGGVSLVGIPLILYFMFIKGVSMGAAVCALISVSSSKQLTVIFYLLPHIIFLVIAILVLGYRSFVFSGVLCRNILFSKRHRINTGDSFFALAVTFLISVFLCYLSALCEGYFVPDV